MQFEAGTKAADGYESHGARSLSKVDGRPGHKNAPVA